VSQHYEETNHVRHVCLVSRRKVPLQKL